jgi:probable rRNA maturation factor
MIEVEVVGVSSGVLAHGPEGRAGRASQHLPVWLWRRLLRRRPRPVLRDAPSLAEVRRLCILAAASAGVQDGHVAIEFVDAERIAKLNAEHRAEPRPTDVLSFPIDGVEPIADLTPNADLEPTADRAPIADIEPIAEIESSRGLEWSGGGCRELGDVIICPEHATDLREAVVHGVLHLVGMDHETDHGEMLALQRELLARESG